MHAVAYTVLTQGYTSSLLPVSPASHTRPPLRVVRQVRGACARVELHAMCHVVVLVYCCLLSGKPWQQEYEELDEHQQWSLWTIMLLASIHLYTIAPTNSQASVLSLLFLGYLLSTHIAKLVPMLAGLASLAYRVAQRYGK